MYEFIRYSKIFFFLNFDIERDRSSMLYELSVVGYLFEWECCDLIDIMWLKLGLKLRMYLCYIEVFFCDFVFISLGYCKKRVCCDKLINIV